MAGARTLEENLCFLNAQAHNDRLSLDLSGASADAVSLLRSKSGHPVPKISGEQGVRLTMHSMVNPLAEAKKNMESIALEARSIIVILGAGMGYHVAEIIDRIQTQPVVVIEKEPYLVQELLSRVLLQERFQGKQIYFITGKDFQETLNRITRIQIKHDFMPFQIIEHAPSVRAFPAFYVPVGNRLRGTNTVNVASRMKYKKFNDEKLRILILHSKYYLLAEILNSLKKLGHSTKVVMVASGQAAEGSQNSIENIIAEIVSFKPDFILTVNHLGFDREGILTRFFTDIELPYASWYVDSPVFILEDFKKQVSPFLSIFVWDRDYVQDLKDRGFEQVCFLPLATDPDIFKKIYQGKNICRHLLCQIGFVGNSGASIIKECLEKIGGGEFERLLLDKAAQIFAASSERYLGNINLQLTPAEQSRYAGLMDTAREAFEPAVTWRATQLYRIACVQKLMKFRPHIYGDAGWKAYVNGSAVLRPELNYYEDLPAFYNSCGVNFNTTSLQMKRGLNQRVFDVPACRAFLLTDYREQIEDMFRVGKEVICYTSPEEIEDLTAYYLSHPLEREKIAAQGHKRALDEHTYVHRVTRLISTMRKLYG